MCRYIEDLDELRDLLTERVAKGWAIAEKEEDKLGRVRKRVRGHGYLIPFLHDDQDGVGSNVITYYGEMKRLDIRLALGYHGTSGKFSSGATPPPCPSTLMKGRFDIVTRTWQPKTGPDAVVWTDARFADHFA